MNYTDEQKKAIGARNTNILVSAAAGSGKTGVLTERVISRLKDGDNIDELLILTFTRAAAGEMKTRIRDKIAKRLENDDKKKQPFWQHQTDLLGDASITTIHSFCTKLLRRHYHLLPGLDPQYRIAKENRIKQMKDDLLRVILEERYTDPDKQRRERCFDLLDLYGSRLNDDNLKKIIFALLDFAASRGEPVEWLEKALKRFGDLDFWHDAALAEGREAVALALREIEDDLETLKRFGGSDGCITTLEKDIEILTPYLTAEWDDFPAKITFAKKKPKKKDDDIHLDEFCKARREARKKYLNNKILPLFGRSFRDYAEDITAVFPDLETLVEITEELWTRFQNEKLKRSLLDFNDLEYYTLKLLTENPALSEEYKAFFKEVLIDEYQDINPLQDKILRLLAGEGRLFIVGDVKQSIYGFRNADHTLFKERAQSYREGEANENGELIRLNRNFRSRSEIISLTNAVFSSLMNEDVAGIHYGEEEKLRYGAEFYKEKDDCDVEFVVIDRSEKGDDGGVDGDDAFLCQGRYIAERIEAMMASGFTVTEKEEMRPLRYGDIAILMRSAVKSADLLAEGLRERNIPVLTPSETGFLSGREGKLLIAFLNVLDNPLQDIPLAALMRSPFFGFDENELLDLSLKRDGKKLWQVVLHAEEYDFTIVSLAKIRSFRREIISWRQRAKVLPVGDLVSLLFRNYDYPAFWGGLPDGKRRKLNLRFLAEEAMDFQEEDGGGLFDFIRYLDYLEKNNGDEREELKEEEDCVRVMSVHKSKGLEFPVVFLARTEQKINKSDLKEDILIDSELGFGPQVKDRRFRTKDQTLPRMLLKLKIERSELGEEMRVLYVAMTRAREKLIIVASDHSRKKESLAEKIEAVAAENVFTEGKELPVTVLHSLPSYYEWLIRCGLPVQILPLPVSPKCEEVPKAKKPIAPGDVERLKKALCRREAKHIPSKVSVTSLLPEGAWEKSRSLLKTPRFLAGDVRLNAAEKGTLFHLIMERIPLEKTWDRKSLEAEISVMAAAGHIDEESLKSLNIDAILTFLSSKYGTELRTAKTIRKELAFVCGFPAGELFPEEEGEERIVTLQGAVDLLYRRESGEWVLLDYKTNDLRVCGKEAFLAKYRRQMELYAAALQRVFHIDVSERVFYLTSMGEFLLC